MGVSIEFKPERLTNYLKMLGEVPKEVEKDIKQATFYVQKVIVRDFLSVADGVSARPHTKIRATKRTSRPGLRTGTGYLKRSVKTDFRRKFGSFEGAVGTDVPYGVIQERKGIYNFLKPGIQKAMPEVRKMLTTAMTATLKGVKP